MGKRSRQQSGRRPERRQDARLTSERIRALDGQPVPGDIYATVVSPVELPDGRVLAFHGPQVVAFNLFEAQRHAERGVKARLRLIGNLYRREDDYGWWGIKDASKGLDCVRDLAVAVLFSYAALEGLGNHTIDQLDENTSVEVTRGGKTVQITRDEMERGLSVAEKLSVVIPAFTGNPSLKGDALWAKFVTLRRLRDALVHPKDRGSNPLRQDSPSPGPDPKDPGIYGLLMRGDADTCADDAIELVRTLRPEFLPPHVLTGLGLET